MFRREISSVLDRLQQDYKKLEETVTDIKKKIEEKAEKEPAEKEPVTKDPVTKSSNSKK
jgi:hypothetical protein